MSCMVPVNSTEALERASGEALLRRREEKMALSPFKLVLLETVGVGLYFAMRPRRRAHGMKLLFMLYWCGS